MKGFGEEVLFSHACATGLGGLVGLSHENPAYPLILNKTEFHATVVGKLAYGQQTGKNRLIYNIQPLSLHGNIPLPYKFSIGFKLSELFNQNFDVYSESIPVANYWTRRHIVGKGGIYGLSAQMAKRLLDDKLGLGFEYTKIIGQELEQWNFEVFEGSYQTSDTVEIRYSAHRLRAGVGASLSDLVIGLVYEQNLIGTISQKVISHNSIVDSVSGVKFNLPQGIGVGLSYAGIYKTVLYADLFYRNWSATTINDTVISRYINSMKISLGVEYALKENLPLKVGIRYYQSYLKDINGKNITEYALTLGSRMPITNFGGIDYSLEIMQRQGQDIKETIGRLNFSFAYEEAWKKRTRRWGY
jgi:opacity protein-like surface antigen